MSLAKIDSGLPSVVAVRFAALGGNRRNSITLDFVDAEGASLASSLTDPAALDAFGRQAMAVALAARASDPNVIPIGQRPLASFPLSPVYEMQQTGGECLESEERGILCLLVSIAALALAIALVTWDLLK